MLRILCEAGGVDYEEVQGLGEERRYATLGALALLTGLIAAVSCALTAFTQLHVPWYAAGAMGILVGLMIWGIDRMFVLTPMLKDTVGYRVGMLVTRGAISLILGLFISHGLVMYAFADDLQSRVESAAVTAADAAEADVRKKDSNQKQIENLHSDNKRLLAAIDAQQKVSDAKRKAWRDNTACVKGTRFAADGDFCGDGGVSPGLKKDWQDYRDKTLATTKTANNAQIATNNSAASKLQAALETKVADARAAAMKNVGIAAKTDALIDLIVQDPFLAFLPLLFIVLDLAVVFSKALFPRSRLDLRAQMDRENLTAMRAGIHGSAAFSDATAEFGTIEANRLLREARSREARAAARDTNRTARYLDRLNRTRTPRNKRLIAAGTACAVLVVGVFFVAQRAWVPASTGKPFNPVSSATDSPMATPSGDGSTRIAEAADTDRSLDLGDGVVLELPEGAISGNAEVKAIPAIAGTKPGREGFAALTPAYQIETRGTIVGKGRHAPRLVLTVPKRLRTLAEAGALSVAFHTGQGWRAAPGRYDKTVGTFAVAMPHFSWWEFWTWDWDSWAAQASQAVLSKVGMRSNETPKCTSGKQTPSWFSGAPGVVDEAGVVIRSCVQGSAKHDGVLDVQIVNNRPVGMILRYNAARVEYGWHQDPGTISEAIQYALGDAAAAADGGLYLPPLGKASVGIHNTGAGSHGIFIGPSFATLGGDVLQVLADGATSNAVGAVAANRVYKVYRDAFKSGMAGDCGKLAFSGTKNLINGEGPSDKQNWLDALNDMLGGDLADCVVATTTVAAREAVAGGGDLSKVVGKFSTAVQYAKVAARAGKLFTVAKIIAEVGDIWADSFFALGEQGYGFTVWARSNPPASADPQPTSQARSQPPATSPRSETQRSPSTGQPEQTVPASPPSSSSSRGLPTLVAGLPVTLYDNYDTVRTPGIPMCAGNPGRLESLPGGILTQTFTVPTTATVNSAVVQIDPASAISVTAAILVDGSVRTSTTAVPIGDTTFTFPPVTVNEGAIIALKLTWAAAGTADNNPKLDTVYTVGSPNGTLTVTNRCSDGAPTLTSSVGLRARVLGTT